MSGKKRRKTYEVTALMRIFQWNDQVLKKMTVFLFVVFTETIRCTEKRRLFLLKWSDAKESVSELFFTKRFWHLFLIQIDGRLEFELQSKPAAWHEFKHLKIITNHTKMERRIIFWWFTWRSMEKKYQGKSRYVILCFSNSIVSFLHSLENEWYSSYFSTLSWVLTRYWQEWS